MNAEVSNLCLQRRRFQSSLDRLFALFEEMDAAYADVAQGYGFRCTGCPDNCCRSRFYHHTLLEYLFLYQGFCQVTAPQRQEIRRRAEAMAKKQAETEFGGDAIGVLCPLNEDEKCVLYLHRPMICRLHGLPHCLDRPGGGVLQGPGCDEFHRLFGESVAHRLDRTVLYQKMARLESEVRSLSACREKFKMTVAQMILSFPAVSNGNHPETAGGSLPESTVEVKNAKD
jgi:hypothetical protein